MLACLGLFWALVLGFSINDARCIHYFLVTKCGFANEDFLVLSDEPSGIPGVQTGYSTRAGILDGIRWLVQGAREGSSLFFFFSGHGSQQRDTSGEERDGYDETILPMDYQSAGMITDDIMYRELVDKVPRGAKLTAICDCCHSGSVLDLPYIHSQAGFKMDTGGSGAGESSGPHLAELGMSLAGALLGRRSNESAALRMMSQLYSQQSRRRGRGGGAHRPDPNKGLCVLISGCLDHQTSADTTRLSGKTVTGGMTYAFLDACETLRQPTYRELLHAMRGKVRAAGLSQVPQLSSSHPFDVNSRFTLY